MVSLNKVLLIGNLTKDPELRYTPTGIAVATLRMAINNTFKDKAGQTQKSTCFLNVVVWGHLAELCNQYLQKGRGVFVEGDLQSRSWKADDGKNRTVLEVRANRVQFMPRPNAVKEGTRDIDLGDAPEAVVNLEGNEHQGLQEVGETNENEG